MLGSKPDYPDAAINYIKSTFHHNLYNIDYEEPYPTETKEGGFFEEKTEGCYYDVGLLNYLAIKALKVLGSQPDSTNVLITCLKSALTLHVERGDYVVYHEERYNWGRVIFPYYCFLVLALQELGSQPDDIKNVLKKLQSDLIEHLDLGCLEVVSTLVLALNVLRAQPEKPSVSKWTLMMYLSGDNDLAPAMDDILNKLKRVGSTEDVNIIALIDKRSVDDGRIYYVKKQSLEDVTKKVTPSLTEFNTGDPYLLESYIKYIASAYPADHYWLTIVNHGNGTYAPSEEEHPSLDGLSIIELGQALRMAGVKIDLMFMYACLMSTVELAHEIKNHVNILVASQERTAGKVLLNEFLSDVGPYDDILSDLVSNPSMTPRELSIKIVDKFAAWSEEIHIHYKGYTFAAMDLTKLSDFITVFNDFAKKLESKADTYRLEILKAISLHAEKYYFPWYVDLFNFSSCIWAGIPDAEIKDAALQVITQYPLHLVHIRCGPEHQYSYGLSIFCPNNAYTYNLIKKVYENTAFAKDTYWDEFLKKLMSTQTSAVTSTVLPDATITEVSVSSSSNIKSTQHIATERKITITISEEVGTFGTTSIIIPNKLLADFNSSIDKILVIMDKEPLSFNAIEVPTGYMITITYHHSEHVIEVYYVTYKLTLIVKDYNNNPFTDAEVKIIGPIVSQSITDSEGKVVFHKLPTGNYAAQVYDGGQMVYETTLTLLSDVSKDLRTEVNKPAIASPLIYAIGLTILTVVIALLLIVRRKIAHGNASI